MTHVRHDGGPRGSGRAPAGAGSVDDDPGRELDEMLSRWAHERDTLYQQDSSWLDELRTGELRTGELHSPGGPPTTDHGPARNGRQGSGDGRHAAPEQDSPAQPPPAVPSGLPVTGAPGSPELLPPADAFGAPEPAGRLPADHPSYPGPDPAGWSQGRPRGRPDQGPGGPNGYPASDPYRQPGDHPGPADLQQALLGPPRPLPPPHQAPRSDDADPGLLTHRDTGLLTHHPGPAPVPVRLAGPVGLPPPGLVGADYPGHRPYPAAESDYSPGYPDRPFYPGDPGEPGYPAEPGYLPPSGPRHGRHRRGGSRWLRIVGWIGAMLGVLVVAVAGWGYYEYRRLSGNVHRIDALAPNDPAIRDAAKQRNAENFLLIGSDTRAGANGRYENTAGQVVGQRSDTTILAHLSPDRDKAILISIPRDSWVDIPACRKPDGSVSRAGAGMFNSAFETGGPKCTVLTVQKLTGVSINHYVQVDFTGFKTMVDALGGVSVCSQQDVYDKESGLRLRKGLQVLRGEQALAYVRARKHIGDWSDLGRIQRQQRFLGAMIRKATSTRLLFNPIALTRFLEAATRSLTLDRSTSFGDLKTLADQVRNLDPKRVTFLTAPIANADYTPPGQAGGGRVLLDTVAGRRLWDSIINDKPAPGKGAAKPPAGPKITLTVAPGDVSVRVLNGVGVQGLARRTAADLTSAGFAVTDTGNSATPTNVSVVRYAPGRVDAARTLAAAVPGSVLQEDASLGRTIVLVAGQSPMKVSAVQVGDAAAAAASSRPPAPVASPKLPVSMSAADASCG